MASGETPRFRLTQEIEATSGYIGIPVETARYGIGMKLGMGGDEVGVSRDKPAGGQGAHLQRSHSRVEGFQATKAAERGSIRLLRSAGAKYWHTT
jgi:hypothetical protein